MSEQEIGWKVEFMSRSNELLCGIGGPKKEMCAKCELFDNCEVMKNAGIRLRAKYYNMRLGPTLLAGFEKKGYLVFNAYGRIKSPCQVVGAIVIPPSTIMKRTTIIIDGGCGLMDTGEIWEQLKGNPPNRWHEVNLLERR